MTSSPNEGEVRPVWFVGAVHWTGQGGEDQTERFVEEGIWELHYTDQYLDRVMEIQPGDKIAIKTQFNRKNGLPFDNRDHWVSVMRIKAPGTVVENMGDGRRLAVDWTLVNPPREWYFRTYIRSVCKVNPGFWQTDDLIRFTFDGEKQDIDQFRNNSYWKDRFGDVPKPASPTQTNDGEQTTADEQGSDDSTSGPDPTEYTIEDIIADGCFLDEDTLKMILNRLGTKKNLILQGPPGTGKTWLAKKLAFALIGYNDNRRVRRFQFHPNLSYEDFIRGFRPAGDDGKLTLVDGPFLGVVNDARRDPSSGYVMVIEEINRGNPAQIFGEMLTLMEADKRSPEDGMALGYPKHIGERVHIPPNVYVIGTMNVADRSIALVDLALRRRFAFVDLEPVFDARWRTWVHGQCGIDLDFLTAIEHHMTSLNERIADDRSLGPQFRVGHSYVTPPEDTPIDNPAEWFSQIVETEIGPLLDEYWFDNIEAARTAKSDLLTDL